MKKIYFQSPSGKGAALVTVRERAGVEFVEVELGLFREMMSDLDFTEVTDAPKLPGAPLDLNPEPQVSGSNDNRVIL